jgi:hypothetical protein
MRRIHEFSWISLGADVFDNLGESTDARKFVKCRAQSSRVSSTPATLANPVSLLMLSEKFRLVDLSKQRDLKYEVNSLAADLKISRLFCGHQQGRVKWVNPRSPRF